MPIRGGDPRYADFVNKLEERLEALEKKLDNLARTRPTAEATEKMVEEAVAEAKKADDAKATEAKKAADEKAAADAKAAEQAKAAAMPAPPDRKTFR